jgi:uncharacterized protein
MTAGRLGTIIRPATAEDYPAVLALNDGAVPAVNSIPTAKLADLHRQGIWLGVAEDADGIAGFLLALDEQAEYDSINFGFFRARYPQFAYVDRVVVRPDRQGAGIGKLLYEGLLVVVRDKAPVLACEVNLTPPNPGSLAFHQRMGFLPVGEQLTEGGSKRVCLMIRPLV